MVHVLFFVIVVVWCLIIARLEIETEGKDGWAKNLPTAKYRLDGEGKLWYKPFGSGEYRAPTCGKFMEKFFSFYVRKMLGGREFTGYHRMIDLMQLFVAHLAVYMLFLGTAPWWIVEIKVIAFLFLSWSIEDTLWFVLNPFYGLKKYRPEFIPWHADDWWIFAPKGMLILFLQGCVVYAISCLLAFYLV